MRSSTTGRAERSWSSCTASAPERIRISVTDTGAGLPPEKLAQLFQPFNRLGQEARRRGRHRHRPGGEQAAGRADGRRRSAWRAPSGWAACSGSSWRSAAAPQLAAGARPRRARRSRRECRPARALRTLLYVEDNPANLKLVEQLIARRPDMRLLSAANGDARHRDRARVPAGRDPDGHQPARHQRHRGPAASCARTRPRRTSRSSPSAPMPCRATSRRGLEAGFFRYLTKPIKVDEFMEALDVALEVAGAAIACGADAKPGAAMISSADILDGKILIVDDQEANVAPARADAARRRLRLRRLHDGSARGLRASPRATATT